MSPKELLNKLKYIDRPIAMVLCTAIMVLIGTAILDFRESQYDYSRCTPTDTYEAKSRPMWIQRSGDVSIVHPARHWNERLYYCPEGDRWRNEDAN